MFTFNEYLFFNVSDSNILSNVIKIVLIHYFSNILKNTYIISHIKKYPIFKTTLLNVIITNIVYHKYCLCYIIFKIYYLYYSTLKYCCTLFYSNFLIPKSFTHFHINKYFLSNLYLKFKIIKLSICNSKI